MTGVRAAEQLSHSILNSLPASVAVIDADGTILATNEAWDAFARENGSPMLAGAGPGTNYLHVCRRSASEGVSDAQAALNGINSVLGGSTSSFQMEYPCHSDAEQRWFLMTASPLKGTMSGAVIAHTNITSRKLAEIAVQTSQSTFKALLESPAQSIVAVNRKHTIVLLNRRTEQMFGYSEGELIGQPLDILVPENSRALHTEHCRAYFADSRIRPMGIGLNLEGRRKDGTYFPLEIALSPIETAQGKLAVAFVSDITQRRRLEESEQAYSREVRALAASLLTAQEEERRRVSRELHDQICQQLASLAFDMGSLAAANPLPRKMLQGRLRALQSRVVKASEQTRHIAYELHSSVLDDLGLVASLRELCRDFLERFPSIELDFTARDLPHSVSRTTASCLYRIAQESLHNIAKHASAKQASISLTFHEGTAVLTIVDDGAGFDPHSVQGQGGLGLIGMQERARLVNGTLSFSSKRGHGTRIRLEVPLAAAGL